MFLNINIALSSTFTLDSFRKAIIEKSRKPSTSNETQTEPMQTLMIKDAKTGIQDDLLMFADKTTETEHGELAIIVQERIRRSA